MSSTAVTRNATRAARTVAPEDLSRGDFVAVSNEAVEFPSYFWRDDLIAQPPHQPVRVQFQGRCDDTPLRVKAVCLPFVFVKSAKGDYETLDVRRCQLVRLCPRYAKRVWKLLRRAEAERNKRP